MYNHAPVAYVCPICVGLQDPGNKQTLITHDDIIYQDDVVTALINSFWMKNNPGHVIIVPNKHIENIFDLPEDIGGYMYQVAKKVALAMKLAYKCEGVMTMQNNEPASDQHAFHFHLHVFPRYENDELHKHMSNKQLADPAKRKEYASKFKSFI